MSDKQRLRSGDSGDLVILVILDFDVKRIQGYPRFISNIPTCIIFARLQEGRSHEHLWL